MVGLPTQPRRCFIASQAYCGKYSRQRSGFSPGTLRSHRNHSVESREVARAVKSADEMVKEMTVQRFDVPYSEAAVEDLRQRLVRTRWPDQIPGSHWDYGVSLDYMKEICQYWKDEFDWKRQIEKMAAFHHYRYTSRGVGIHFIHERGEGPAPIPLILTHGWPGSFLEMLKVIPMLADPAGCGANSADAFDVIVPSLPGYGFSDR